ncbi:MULTISPECIES: hypothetical protein [Shouchella]|uniref:Uncharacterized protein n=1 Tax=Shouchella lehensis G1 TaxID=1246626 RepID=A0A060LQU7_9BACI|nr:MULTISPECIES: hypothetical protein [Bacillaceae]AIC93636.1 hypothetical protein BleG1_1033 [Shouchella lehensis G1]
MEEKMHNETGENLVVGALWALLMSIPLWIGIAYVSYKLFLSFS